MHRVCLYIYIYMVLVIFNYVSFYIIPYLLAAPEAPALVRIDVTDPNVQRPEFLPMEGPDYLHREGDNTGCRSLLVPARFARSSGRQRAKARRRLLRRHRKQISEMRLRRSLDRSARALHQFLNKLDRSARDG